MYLWQFSILPFFAMLNGPFFILAFLCSFKGNVHLQVIFWAGVCIPLFIMASIEAYTVVTIHLYGGTVHLYGGPLGLVP